MIKYVTIKKLHDLLLEINNADDSSIYDFEIDLCKNEGYSSEHNKILDLLIKNIDKFKNNTRKIDFVVPYEKIPKKEFLKLCKLYESFDSKTMMGVNVKHWLDNSQMYDWIDDSSLIKEFTQRWDIKTIIKANSCIDSVCEFIKNNNFSPFEALAFVHNYVSTITKYKPSVESSHSWRDKDQFFAGAYLDLPEFVCAGYSSLMKEIIDNLNMKGLQCDIVNIEFENMQTGVHCGHDRCIVYIKDKKYGIDQSCYDDPTWDYLDNGTTPKYAHFAMSNNCHDIRLNKKFSYTIPTIYIFSKNNACKQVNECYPSIEYNKSINQIDQLMIEKVHFNVLQKINPNATTTQLYERLAKIASESFNEQTEMGYLGYLKQKELVLTQQQAKRIYELNRDNCKERNFDM